MSNSCFELSKYSFVIYPDSFSSSVYLLMTKDMGESWDTTKQWFNLPPPPPYPLSSIHSFYFLNQFLFINPILFFFLLLLINNFLYPNFFHFRLIIVEYHPLSMFPVHLCVSNIISYSNVTLYLSWSSLADIESTLNKVEHCTGCRACICCCNIIDLFLTTSHDTTHHSRATVVVHLLWSGEGQD